MRELPNGVLRALSHARRPKRLESATLLSELKRKLKLPPLAGNHFLRHRLRLVSLVGSTSARLTLGIW